MPSTRRIARLIASLLVAVAVVACAPSSAAPAANPATSSAPAAAPAAPAAPAGGPAVAPSAEAPPRVTVRTSYSSVDLSQIPLWVAHDAGFLAAQGLDVELIFVESGSKALQTLLAGEVPTGLIGAAAIVAAVAGGADVAILASMADRYPYKLMGAPAIQRPADLRGQRLGISRFGSSSDLATRAALKLSGLSDADVQILQIGGDVQRVAAMQSGAIDGAVLTPPATNVVRRAGFNEVVDLSRLADADYQHNTFVATRAFIGAQPDVVQRYVRALAQAIHYAWTDKEGTKQIVMRYNQLEDPEGLEEAYLQYFAPDAMMLTRVPTVKPRSLSVTIDEVATDRPDARRLRYEDLVDDRFVRALEDSGFVRQVYGN
jgi:NitT/TauT family transport system substrate-binding protein